MLLRKQGIKRCFVFPSHLTNAFALPGKMLSHRIASFLSNAVLLYHQSLV